MGDIDPSRGGRRARGRLLPLPPEAPGGLWTTSRTRGSPLSTRSSRAATCDSWRRTPSAAATEPLRLLKAARYTVLADDDHANEAPRVPSRKTTAPRRVPVAVPGS
jgi:hypothetical protein